MNKWTQYSIDYANQRNYLDELFKVYPTIPDGIRDINDKCWNNFEKSFNDKDNISLINNLIKFDLFPIKDSYVAYLKRDSSSILRNPRTINRICGRIYEMGLEEVYKRCSEPKETNRQIGPLFKNWLKTGVLGLTPVTLKEFQSNDKDAILDASDNEMKKFSEVFLNYDRNKGLDFVARFNKQYIIGEAKFLTDFGGHQNAQFSDAISTLDANVDAIKIAILDGVLYIKSNNKMHSYLSKENSSKNIMSALVLRDFLYQL